MYRDMESPVVAAVTEFVARESFFLLNLHGRLTDVGARMKCPTFLAAIFVALSSTLSIF
jgi:hypothetical protein